MIAKMKPLLLSQSKSPASVPRLAEMSGLTLLYMIGLLVKCRPPVTMVRGLGSLNADRVHRAMLSTNLGAAILCHTPIQNLRFPLVPVPARLPNPYPSSPWSPIVPYVLATFRRLLDHLTSRDRDRGARRGSRSSRVGGCGAIGPNFARMPRKVRMRGDSGSRAVIRC
jgi:hypothetical protein